MHYFNFFYQYLTLYIGTLMISRR